MAERIRDSEASQEKILDAAETLFIEQGYSATSLRQVAHSAQVAKSLIFHHFQTKAALWDEVKARRMRAFAERQQAVFDQGAISLTRLTDAIREYFELLQQDPALVRMLMQATLEHEEGHCDLFDRQLVEQFVGRLALAQQQGVLRDGPQPGYLLALILSAVNYWFEAKQKFTHWPQISADAAGDEAYLLNFIDVLLHGVLPREERE